MHNVGFVYDDVMLKHAPPPWHPESKERLLRIRTSLEDSHLWEKLAQIKPQKADLDYVALVHTGEHVEKIRTSGEGCLDPDTYISNDSLEAALYAAGSIIEAVKRCNNNEVKRVFCAVRPPGHHAEADSAMGFCLLNNIAVGARYAQTIGYQKVFIIDFDAHHGNGTQHIFEEDETVFYFSTHQYPYYPDTGRDAERGKGKGTGYTYNVQMLAGSGNKDYLYVYQDILPDLVRRFSPDLILVSAGYDIHANDHHANIRVTSEGIRGMVRSILTCSSTPIVFILEGGYDLESLAESVSITIEEMIYAA
ncbi:MAG: acetoin utilization protein [Deltaproteobacteria bacterium]|jgi:acetoin utilization deacetylase AcuC-like enzyme|nr:acetoin utilization protein [Deltaproteobacteria bacterium]